MSATNLLTAHLNAPYGPVLAPSDLRDSLKNGRLCGRSLTANAVLATMFAQAEPRLIGACALEAGVTIGQANQLYLDTLAHSFARCAQWEAAVEHLV